MTLNPKNTMLAVFHWWTGALIASLPASLRSWISSRRQRVQIRFGSEGFLISIDGRENIEELVGSEILYGDPAEAGRQVSKWLNKNKVNAVGATIYLPAERVLTPTIEMPIDAAGNLAEVITGEIERQTPFSPSEVHHTFHVTGSDPDHDTLSVRLNIARIVDVKNCVDIANSAGFSDVMVCKEGEVDPRGGDFIPQWEKPVGLPASSWLALSLVAAILVLAGVATYLPFERMRQVDRLADEQITELKAENSKLSAAADTILSLTAAHEKLIDNKVKATTFIGVLAEITKYTPDHSWLHQVRINNNQIMISGFSEDATGLVRSLEKSDLFRDVTFSAPVTTDSQRGVDRFFIAAHLNSGKSM